MNLKNEKQKTYLLLVFTVALLIVIGYAFLTQQLNINGQTQVKKSTWDVHFENLQVKEESVTASSPASIASSKTSASFTVTLTNPGDFYEFTVDEKNAGTIDAMVSTLSKTSLTTTQAKYLDYTVTYSDDKEVVQKQLLTKGTMETIKVRVAFKKDLNASDLPSSDTTLNLSFALNYVQADETAVAIKHSSMELDDTNSNGRADIGEMITIGTERFYVISNDNTNIKALAEWNLLVGNQYISGSRIPLENPTGLQSSTAKGYLSNEYPWKGIVSFSTSSYWSRGSTIELNNSVNLVYPYLTAYKTSLENLDGKISVVTLITQQEIEALINEGEKFDSYLYIKTRADNKNLQWLYQTTYWTRSALDSDYVSYITTDGNFSNHYFRGGMDEGCGIRPVIQILASDL